ncbi:unnamed protein product [Malus baccata var. baccata]
MRGSMVVRLALIFTILSMAASIDDKCTACNAVAEELELGLSNVRFSIIPMFFDFAILHITSLVTGCSFIRFVFQEKPRNHLDMRHRLDSTGQRRGKVIDYRVSELRAVELLDGLCDKMQDYTLHKKEWVKVDSWDNLTISKQEAKAYSKDLSTYCGRLLEDTEDELTELIKKGSVRVGDVSKVLCQDLSKHCSRASVSNGSDGEL